MTLQELRDKRSKLAAQMNALVEKCKAEKRAMQDNEASEFDTMDAELEALDVTIKRMERVEQLAAPRPTDLRAAGAAGAARETGGDERADSEREVGVFNSFLRFGFGGLEDEERAIAQRHMANLRDRKELRAFAAGTANVGGYTVPQDFLNRLEIALKHYGGMLDVAEIIRTDTGATLPMPTFNYTAVAATIVGEGAGSVSDSSTPFGVANLGAFTYRSPLLPVSYEFLQDTAFGDQYIIDALAGSIGRALNTHFTTGDGSGKPRGIVTDAVSGKVGTTGQTATVITDDLIDLEHSVDLAYRMAGACRFMMHDSSWKVVKKLKDSQNRPLYLPGYAERGPDTLLGYPVTLNNDVATMAANAKSIYFGALNKYKARIVRDVTVLRLQERYADQLQVAFLLFTRADGRLLDAGTNPVKYYANSAT